MVNKVILTLEQPEYSALLKAALAELRDPSNQARHILRLELGRRGLLTPADRHAEAWARRGRGDPLAAAGREVCDGR